MAFKLGSENRGLKYGQHKNRFNADNDASIPGVPVIRKKLNGPKAEANIDGTIFLDESVEPGSQQERAILMHEMKHMVDMKTGKLSYDDDKITWMGQDYERKDGKINFNGDWVVEGDYTLPWEQH
jgi:hypothetical protein